MLLLLEHPELPTCQECQQWVYDPKKWRREKRGGEDVPRVPGTPLPCWQCPKIPHGIEPVPENAVELSPRNSQCYEHYLRCKAVNRFPRDAIVERNAGLIRWAEEQTERNRHRNLEALLKIVAGVKT